MSYVVPCLKKKKRRKSNASVVRSLDVNKINHRGPAMLAVQFGGPPSVFLGGFLIIVGIGFHEKKVKYRIEGRKKSMHG